MSKFPCQKEGISLPADELTVREQERRTFLRATGSVALLFAPSLGFLPGCGGNESADLAAEAKQVEISLTATRRKAAPDGRPREILCYNDGLPGPLIRAKVGEKLRITVSNQLAVPTTVHWHGMYQIGSWQMDGVEGVTQQGIPPKEAFTYEFIAEPAGTHWYHSHAGVQYGDGLFGPLIVEEETPIAKYDREEILQFNDWFLESGDAILAHLRQPHSEPVSGSSSKASMPNKMKMKMKAMAGKDLGDVPFQSLLINGRGRYLATDQQPLTQIGAQPGETLRLRLINSSSTYALRFQVDNHPLTVIATDGQPVAPVEIDNLWLGVGETYDVLLHTNPEGAFWIRAGTGAGGEGLALLKVPVSSPDPEPTTAAWKERVLALTQLRSLGPVSLDPAPREIPLRLGGTMSPYAWDINGQYYPDADKIVVKKGESLRFILENTTRMDHPFHLHGHSFYVLGKPGSFNLKDPPRKDTLNVPAGETLVIQWVAENSGLWFFHCHIEWHLATGMARVIEIPEA